MSDTVWGKMSAEERATRLAYKAAWRRKEYHTNPEYRAKVLAYNKLRKPAKRPRIAKSVTDADLDAMAAATLEEMRNARQVEPICVRSASTLAG